MYLGKQLQDARRVDQTKATEKSNEKAKEAHHRSAESKFIRTYAVLLLHLGLNETNASQNSREKKSESKGNML